MKKFQKISIKLIQKFLLLFLTLLFFSPVLNADPYLKIDRADAELEFPQVKIYLTLNELNKTISENISEENFSLHEDGFMVNYTKVKKLSETEGILYIVMGMDSSKSIKEKVLKELKQSAVEFLNQPGPKDMLALYRFNDEAVLLNNFTNNKDELIKNINSVERHGKKTLLYNALYNSMELLNKSNIPRKAVLVFTDGKDEGSSIELSDIIEYSRSSRIPIYCVAFDPKDEIKKLSRLSLLTGGKLFNSNKNDISTIYKSIRSSIKEQNQYLLEYKTLLAQDGKEHNIEVKFRHEGIRDSEQIKLNYKQIKSSNSKAFIFQIPTFYEAIIIALILILIFLLIILIAFFIRHYSRILITPAGSQAGILINSGGEKTEQRTEDLKKTEEKTEEKIPVKAWLVEREGVNAGKKLPIQYEEVTIGRSKENRIVLEDKSVSKKHAKIKLIKNSFYLFDMVSDKGTYLNENKLLRPKLLYDWDEIRMGKKVFIFRISNAA